MPPPKKPKSGPTSIEQFMSRDEIRSSDDDEMRERTGSCSSDISVVSTKSSDGKEAQMYVIGMEDKSPSGLKLLRDLITKKTEEEQRVQGSCSSERSSPQSLSPTAPAEDTTSSEQTTTMTTGLTPEEKKKHPPGASSPISPLAGSVLPPFGNNTHPQTAATSVRGSERLLNSMVASSLMSPFPHSPTTSSYSTYFPSYLYGQSLQNSYYLNNFEVEPRDLSTKIQKENQNRENRHYERSSIDQTVQRDIEQRLSAHFGIGTFDSLTERKDLDSRKNLVGILTEPRYNHLRFSLNSMDRETGSFPFFVNNGFESRRDSIEKLVPKEEPHGAHHPTAVGGMVPQTGFLSMPYMMHNQVPSSTTLDFRDHEGRILPLLDPSLSFADGRKLKHSSVAGPGPNKLCQVCNDNASGFHYGVWSCEGCKAFFKRSIQGPVDYVCPATNTCTIDKHRRKSCQACRLRKCYEVGMNKGSQRKERKGSLNSMSKPTTKRSRADSSDNTVNSTSGSPNPAKSARKSQTVIILQALNKAALPVLESYHNHSQPPTKVHLLNSLVKLAERELVHLINWAKNVPGYTDLSLSDQVHLIECCWMELLLLNCAFRSIEHGGKSLVFAPDLILDRSLWNMVEMTEIFEQVAAVSEQMVQNNLHKDELLLLQATVLVNAEVRRLSSFNQIQSMQQSLLDAIVDTAQKYHPDNLRHVPSVLLLLTHIRQAGERGIAYFQKLKTEGIVTFCDLLKEMLDAQDFLEKKSSVEGD